MRLRIVALAATVALAACGQEQASPTKPSTTAIVQEDPELGGLALTAYATTPIEGSRPQLYVSCSFGSPSLQVDVIQNPEAPTSLAGNFAEIEADDARWTAEVSNPDWHTGVWMVRDEKLGKTIAAKVLSAKSFRFRTPSGSGPRAMLEWDLSIVDGPLQKMRETCIP